ncbi:unnamed protein product [Spirodela intermedia]|uniref:Uncharacterized protein n=1 Tax=Spirodela intermedia TaxID=51605 RepID=A0A7I8IA85_SPIIN|nr:unnamed protein product [Spirodela intermedia]CAA6654323.1 unnamed protein product [Spirodela intermedia]
MSTSATFLYDGGSDMASCNASDLTIVIALPLDLKRITRYI